MRSNAPRALLCKDRGERSEDFWAAQQRKSNGIFNASGGDAAGSFLQEKHDNIWMNIKERL
jgi:hypothetical protein